MELKEAVDCLENMISDYVISAYCDECHDKDNCTGDCYFRVAIDTVLSELDRLKKENEEKEDLIRVESDHFTDVGKMEKIKELDNYEWQEGDYDYQIEIIYRKLNEVIRRINNVR